MRQYAGFGSAAETNKRYRFLLEQGQTGLSVAFDLPTQMGYDPDAPMARGEAGKVGVSIASLEDMQDLFEGIPLDRVSTSMTINATASILLALYVATARRQGVAADALSGTVQNDILKEYIARGHLHLPAGPLDAADHRHVRVLPGSRAALEHDLDLRLPHARGRLHRGAGGRLHAGQRRSPTCRRRVDAGPRRRRLRPAALVLLQRAQRPHRGGREVPRGAAAVGADHARALSRPRPARRWRSGSTRRRPAAC